MKNTEVGSSIKIQGEEKGMPQRIVAQALDIDTGTLSKMKLGEKQISISMIRPLANYVYF